MKLILMSSGLDNEKVKKEFSKLIDGRPSNKKVLIIFGVKTEEEWDHVDESRNELISLGILRDNIIEANISEDISEKNFKEEYDVVYVCGGNTFYILDRLRKTSFDKLIKKLVEENKVYVGVSAGSIIAGPNIEMAEWGSEGDGNEVGLKNLEGFKFTNILFFPHYKNELKKEIDEFQKKTRYKIERFKNGEALIINEKEIKRIR